MDEKLTVAVCDILGFSDVVATYKLQDVLNQYEGWLRRALAHSLFKHDFPESVPSMSELASHPTVGTAWFSDTILLFSRDDSVEGLQAVIETAGWLLFESMLASRTLRCGIAYGEMHIDQKESSFVGMPLVEAYRLEQGQAWAGGAIASSAEELVPELARSGELFEWWIVPYDVPGKQGSTVSSLAINWTQGVHRPDFDVVWSDNTSEPSPKDWIRRPSVAEKWWNTKLFHDTICRIC